MSKSMKRLRRHIFFVEEAIQQMGIDPALCRTKESRIRWEMHRSDSQILIFLREGLSNSEDTKEVLVITSPIMPLPKDPEKRMQCMEQLMQLNHRLIRETLSIMNDWIFISASNYIEFLTEEEVVSLLDSLSFYAHKFSVQFKEAYMPKLTPE